jgi:hypothetical protein
MAEMVNKLIYFFAAGMILFFGVFALRFLLRLAWKFVRTILIILSLILIAGFFFGFFDIFIH